MQNFGTVYFKGIYRISGELTLINSISGEITRSLFEKSE
jgi:hypothetical protein